MSVAIQCECGELKGKVKLMGTRSANRSICYCKSCQAFATYLQRRTTVLDTRGGSRLFQVSPESLTFTQGTNQLVYVNLAGKGLLRWYSRCCKTPIANVPANFKMAFVGLLEGCIDAEESRLQTLAGSVPYLVGTDSAWGEPKPVASSGLRLAWAFGPALLKARITGAYKRTPFFNRQGHPVSQPENLERAAYGALLDALQQPEESPG